MWKIRLEIITKNGEEFPFQYRPSCSALEWMEMIQWCVDNCSNDEVVVNATWFRFKHESSGKRFFQFLNEEE